MQYFVLYELFYGQQLPSDFFLIDHSEESLFHYLGKACMNKVNKYVLQELRKMHSHCSAAAANSERLVSYPNILICLG